MKRKFKKSKIGLNGRRIDMRMPENLSCFMMSLFSPFYGAVIGRQAGGLTANQVYRRAREFSGGLRSIRSGESPIADIIIRRYSVKYMTEREQHEATQLLDNAQKMIRRQQRTA